MSKRILFYNTGRLCWGILLFLLAGCRFAGPPKVPTPLTSTVLPAANTPENTIVPTPTPLPTDVPLAARVGGDEITLAEFQAELSMYQAAKGTELALEDKKRVLDDLIDQTLLDKAAREKGFVIDDTLIGERTGQLITQLGSEQALENWLIKYGFVEQTFRRSLERSIAAAWMRDQIANAVPKQAEQVHVRQILLYDAQTANDIYQQLQSGNSFRNLALKYDPITGGDLGWFPRGYLPDKPIEEAAFNLKPDEYSAIIETSAGFHIIQVLERDPQRELSPDALLVLQTQALQDWLDQQRETSQIEVLLP
jgi:peptidyl-prolyl cis-trans isomerase C